MLTSTDGPLASSVRRPVLVLLVATLAHLSFYWAMPAMIWPDSARFAALAEDFPARLRLGQWDAVTAPGYPAFLWLLERGLHSVEGVLLVQHVLGVGTCLLGWWVARSLIGPKAGLVAGLVLALDPIRHYYAQTLLSESLAEFLVAAAMFTLIAPGRRRPGSRLLVRLAAGALVGAVTLVRSNLTPLVVAAVFWPTAVGGRRRRLAEGSTALLGFGLAVVPWLVYNGSRGVSGVTGNLGYQLALFSADSGIGRDSAAKVAVLDGDTDRRLARQSVAAIRAQPVRYLRAVAKTAACLVFSIPGWGDTSFYAAQARNWDAPPKLTGLSRARPDRGAAGWRTAVHLGAATAYAFLVPLGWGGLVRLGRRGLAERRGEILALVGAVVLCVGVLLVLIQANARYAFPLEVLALGLGLSSLLPAEAPCPGERGL